MSEDAVSSCTVSVRESAGILVLQLGDPAKAARWLDGATSTVARTNHGFALLGLGHAVDALADFDAVLAGEVGNDEATFGRGLCLVELGRTREAAMAFEDLLARSPNHLSAPAARQQLARLHGGVGKR